MPWLHRNSFEPKGTFANVGTSVLNDRKAVAVEGGDKPVADTFLATLGRGEHYFVDLVVACPFTLAVQAAVTPASPRIRRPRRHALFCAAGLLAVWYVLLFFGTPVDPGERYRFIMDSATLAVAEELDI